MRGQLSDVSLAGMGIRAPIPEALVKPGVRLLIRVYSEGRAFSLPAAVVWTREYSDDYATVGLRLSLKSARPEARKAFRTWTRQMAKARGAPGALPAREQVECRLAALMGELDGLAHLLAEGDGLDDGTLREIDAAAERLQNSINALELRARR